MRHLTHAAALAALNRGAGIQQLLPVSDEDEDTVRWVTARPDRTGQYLLTLHHVFDEGTEDFMDVAEFSPVDDEEYVGEGKQVAQAPSAEGLLEAARQVGARDGRWVNQGVIDDEYRDSRSE